MKIISPRKWWKARHYRALRKHLPYIDMGTQLGAAHAIIANIALTMPRDKRRGFLVLQRDKIAELTKFAVEKEASAKLDSL